MMAKLFFILMLALLKFPECHGFRIRLWPTNDAGTESFVEAFHDGSWGFVGNPDFRFNDVTASVLCRILGISHFGYGSSWTPLKNYAAFSWLELGLECHGNETDAGECTRLGDWKRYDYSGRTGWAYKYGTRLHCVDTRLIRVDTNRKNNMRDNNTIINNNIGNSGVVEASFEGEQHYICYDGFNDAAANVVCRSLGYENALSHHGNSNYTASLSVQCTGRESSLSKCGRRVTSTDSCSTVAVVTCDPFRLNNLNGRKDEGVVEIFHTGSWGLIGNPGNKFDDNTASVLCEHFGLGHQGFGYQAHHLGQYEGMGLLDGLKCAGKVTDIQICEHHRYARVPPLMHTYRRASWLYCFPYNIEAVRLRNGFSSSDGRVELNINGRWGSICTHKMKYAEKQLVSRVICKQMGYTDIADVVTGDDRGHNEDLFWMNGVVCKGHETNIADCFYEKGSSHECYSSPTYLRVNCTSTQ